MKIDAAMIRRIATLNVPVEAMREMFLLLAEQWELDEARLSKDRDRKRPGTSMEEDGKFHHEGTGNSGNRAAKEIPPTPPKENNTLSEKEGFEESKKVVNARARKSYPELFEKFWAAFPTDPGMSKAEAFKAWGRLPSEDHQPAIDAIPAFKEWVRKQGETYRIVHACRYLSQRRFDGFKAQAAAIQEQSNVSVYVHYGTDAGDAWYDHFKTQGKIAPRDSNGGWWFPSMFPSEGATQ